MTDRLALDARVSALERQNRLLRGFVVCFGMLMLIATVVSVQPNAQQARILRVRELIVEDEAGRPRIRMGAPFTSQAGSPRIGMRITDERGFERFGLGLFADGRLVMGLDGPPPASGKVGNLERINLVADSDGGAYIVFKGRDSREVGRTYLDSENRVWVQFSDYTQTAPLVRRIGLKGEETIRLP